MTKTEWVEKAKNLIEESNDVHELNRHYRFAELVDSVDDEITDLMCEISDKIFDLNGD